MKIEFEITLTDFEKSLVEHLEIECGGTVTEILRQCATKHLLDLLSARRKDIANILSRSDKINDAILAESLEVAKARAPSW